MGLILTLLHMYTYVLVDDSLTHCPLVDEVGLDNVLEIVSSSARND